MATNRAWLDPTGVFLSWVWTDEHQTKSLMALSTHSLLYWPMDYFKQIGVVCPTFPNSYIISRVFWVSKSSSIPRIVCLLPKSVFCEFCYHLTHWSSAILPACYHSSFFFILKPRQYPARPPSKASAINSPSHGWICPKPLLDTKFPRL